MTKRKTKNRGKKSRTTRTRKAVATKRTGRTIARTRKTISRSTVLRQPLTALQDSFSSVINYFK